MYLSDNEKRDIQKYIEAGKPLPDKYRFLLFEEKQEVELVWNGKTNEVTNTVLPFQVIEQVDEPRSEKTKEIQGLLFGEGGRQISGWTNKLIWGDNKLILSSLKNGPLRQEIEEQGGIKLIYIDPPFDVGADFSMNIEIGDEEFTKKPNVLEELAYRDTWGKGQDSFLGMIYERMRLMSDLLAPDGHFLIHCDQRLNASLRFVISEVFGSKIIKSVLEFLRQAGKTITKQNRHAIKAVTVFFENLQPTPQKDFIYFLFGLIKSDSSDTIIQIAIENLLQIKPRFVEYEKDYKDLYESLKSWGAENTKKMVLDGLLQLKSDTKLSADEKEYWGLVEKLIPKEE